MDTNTTIQAINGFSFSPDWISALSTIILVIATSIYVYFTYRLTKETTKLREIETTPFVSISFDTSFVSKFKLVIKNISKTPAYNISFSIDEKYASHFNYNFRNKISYFAPNQEFSILSSGYQEFDKLDTDYIPITIKYQSKDKVIIKDTFNMEWKYLDSTLLETDSIDGIKKAVEGIEKEIKALNKTIQKKEHRITTKLKILELEKTDMYLKFVFSNGYLGKIHNDEISKIGITNIEQTYSDNGDLVDRSIGVKFTAEEIYYKLQKNNHKENKC